MSLRKLSNKNLLVIEVSLVLACKLCAIFGLWYFFFGPDKRVQTTPDSVAQTLLEHSSAVPAHLPQGDPQ